MILEGGKRYHSSLGCRGPMTTEDGRLYKDQHGTAYLKDGRVMALIYLEGLERMDLTMECDGSCGAAKGRV